MKSNDRRHNVKTFKNFQIFKLEREKAYERILKSTQLLWKICDIFIDIKYSFYNQGLQLFDVSVYVLQAIKVALRIK